MNRIARRRRYLRFIHFFFTISTLAYLDKTISFATILSVFAVFDSRFLHQLRGEVYQIVVVLVRVVMLLAINRDHMLLLTLLALGPFKFVQGLFCWRVHHKWRTHSFQLSIVLR